jgi:hypothetical protein
LAWLKTFEGDEHFEAHNNVWRSLFLFELCRFCGVEVAFNGHGRKLVCQIREVLFALAQNVFLMLVEPFHFCMVLLTGSFFGGLFRVMD